MYLFSYKKNKNEKTKRKQIITFNQWLFLIPPKFGGIGG